MESVIFGRNGLIINSFSPSCPESGSSRPGKGKKRGSVDGFSAASARRLRQFLATHVGEGITFALSLTFPFDLSPEEFRRRFHRFCVRCPYPFVWRVELTKRKRPHVHIVGWSSNGVWGVCEIQNIWWDIAEAYIYRGGEEHSCVVELLRGADWFKYLACHSSKHKQEQLGWLGRQWGVVRRGLLVDTGKVVALRRDQTMKVLRVVRRLARCRLQHYGVVGSSTWFLRPGTVSDLLSWARGGSL